MKENKKHWELVYETKHQKRSRYPISNGSALHFLQF